MNVSPRRCFVAVSCAPLPAKCFIAYVEGQFMSQGAYFELGDLSFPITTSSAPAQLWFDRGLSWIYGFNQDEAVCCFRRAAEFDAQCAMAYWGEAYACGPFYNMPWEQFGEHEAREATGICFRAAQKALGLATRVSAVEKALIGALSQRFPLDHPISLDVFSGWEDDYANAMRDVYAEFPEMADVIALTAEALMTRTPWKLWDVATATPACGSHTLEVIDMLEMGLSLPVNQTQGTHIGLAHMYIHALEMSPTPEKALKWADALTDRSPDNGHLQHMPSHIYVLCGLYEEAITVSDRAIAADTKYLDYAGAFNFYSVNRCHALHMKMHASMLCGHFADALNAADALVDMLPENLLRIDKPFMAMTLEAYYSSHWHVLVRFGKWRQIIDTPLPTDQALYRVTTALGHYARGVAYSAIGDVAGASAVQTEFREAVSRVPLDRIMGNNPVAAVLAIADAMLTGELRYRQADYEAAFTSLREAVVLNDALAFSEPWPWMHPPRHALGALLLERGAVQEAMLVYRADLGLDTTLSRCCTHPDNVWSLHGYVECLRSVGDCNELPIMLQRLSVAVARADVPVVASCCCRTGH